MMYKKFAFVLMPFDKAFDDIYILGIKAACSELNIYCERIDEQIFSESILDRIYNQIAKADILIADMTGKNPNVFYEVGFSHALQKQIILLTQNADDIPFDLKHYHHIVYGGSILKLKEDLAKRIDWFVRNPTQTQLPNIVDLEYYFRGQKLENDCEIEVDTDHPYIISEKHVNKSYGFNFQLDIFNPNERFVKVQQQIAIISPSVFFENKNSNIRTIRLPDGRYMHFSQRHQFELYPKMWDFIKFAFVGAWELQPITEPFTLRIHNAIEINEIGITVNFINQG